MDGHRFDALTLRIAASRRGVFKALLAAAAGGVLGRAGEDRTEAAACRPVGSICTEDAACCSRRCGLKDRTGRRHCGCQSTADCPAPSNQCEEATCSGGVCSTRAKQNGIACNDGKTCTENDVCQDGVCRGTPKSCPVCKACSNGECRAVDSDARCAGSCVNGSCVNACLEVQALCDPISPTCCQVEPTECTYEANCRADQGEARCCRPIGARCGERCD